MNLRAACFCVIAICAFTLAGDYSIGAQTLSEHRRRIDTAVERRDDSTAISELKSLRKAAAPAFAGNNYNYLLARLAERRGDRATAAASYQEVVSQRSVLSQYALWHLAQFARATGNLPLEREHLRRIITGSPSSLLRTTAVFRLGQSFFESADFPATIVALQPISGPKVSATARAALLLTAQAHLRSGQTEAARSALSRLITEAPDISRPDDHSLAAARSLDELDAGKSGASNVTAPKLTEAEHLRRAAIYQFNRDFAAARRHYQAVLANYSQSASVSDALYQIGRGLFQEAKYEEAITWFQQVQQKSLTSGSARDALAQMAAAQNRLKRTDEAVASYVHFIYRYPEAPNPERPYLNLIDVLREAGRDDEALKWVQQTRQRFKGQNAATLALFAQARIHLAQSAWPAALEDVESLQKESDLGSAQTAGSTNQAELAFMRGYVLEQLGQQGEAIWAFLQIPDGRNEYYGGQATLRLRALYKLPQRQGSHEGYEDAARQALERGDFERARAAAQAGLRVTEDAAATRDLLEIARLAYARLPAYNPFPSLRLVPVGRQELVTNSAMLAPDGGDSLEPSHQALADELLFLGLYDEGAPELAAARRGQPAIAAADGAIAKTKPPVAPSVSGPVQASPSDLDYTMAVFFLRGGHANQAMRFAQPLWRNVPRDYLLALAPRQLAELLYPAPYATSLVAHGPKRGIDPRFLLAVARQESAFLPEAKSASAARGLMQFISATAADIAAQLGDRSFRDERLYDPDVAILFGAQYLSNLFKRFPDMPQAVAASYNGGDENMARWIARSRSREPDRYVLEIGFAQTKDYVYRVMSNYRSYQILYSDQLQPR